MQMENNGNERFNYISFVELAFRLILIGCDELLY